jgi:hypothetical protein
MLSWDRDLRRLDAAILGMILRRLSPHYRRSAIFVPRFGGTM